ncbi:N-ethylmaleimide reductase [compost metagenome]
MDQLSRGSSPIPRDFLQKFRTHYHGTLVLAGGMTKERAEQFLRDGMIDIAAFGEPFIANPDLVERLRNDWPLLKPDRALSYGGGAQGYTDYPTYPIA